MDYHLDEFNLNPEILEKVIKSNILMYCLVLLLVLRIISLAVSVNLPYNIFFADITKITLEKLVNQSRQSAGLPALAENEKLDKAAELKAQNMVQNQYFNHTSPTGVTPWYWFSQAGYNYKYAGENLAVGFFESEEVYNAWLNSPTHKENMMNPNYKEIGTAVLKGFGDGNAIIVVQLFGSQKAVASKPVTLPVVTATTQAAKTTQATETVQTTQKSETVQTTTLPVENSPDVNNAEVITEKPVVLSQSTEISDAVNTATGNIKSRMINYVLYNYDDLLSNTTYGVSLILMGIMLSIIFLKYNFGFSRQLVLRSALIVLLLSASTLVNKDILVLLIPHQIKI